MKSAFSIILLAVLASGCARDQGVLHHTEFYDVVLSPRAPSIESAGIRLVSISRTGRVTISAYNRRFSARVGQYFVAPNGDFSEYYLKSVDPDSGQVLVRGEMRIYTSF
jgi:hypothetical protein